MPVLSSSGFQPVVFFLIWRPPALPHRLQCSTIGRLGLNRRVRDGNGCFPQPHRHQKDSRYLSKCTRMRKRLLEACFHKDFLSGLYKRRSRDWGASLRSALTCLDNSTVKHIWFSTYLTLERRWSSRTFRYGYLVTTSPQSSVPPSAVPPLRLGHWLRALLTPMVWRAVCTRPGNVFTAAFWSAITSDSSFV